ncbi:MAG TPA: hypothetical protein VN408_41395 [Actinoplanes sp.]|nr:hypothetical protein [Actinoplanes sp.]
MQSKSGSERVDQPVLGVHLHHPVGPVQNGQRSTVTFKGSPTAWAENERTLARYHGTLLDGGEIDPDVAQYGRELVGLYAVLENYNALSRTI